MIRFLLVSLFLFYSVQSYSSITNKGVSYPQVPRVGGSFCTTHDPDFEEFRYSERIAYCKRNVTYWRRMNIYDQYHIPRNQTHNFTIDHRIVLSTGGSNKDDNLWPEHKILRNHRMGLEYDLYRSMLKGLLTQDEVSEITLESKFDRKLLEKPSYESYEGLSHYLSKRWSRFGSSYLHFRIREEIPREDPWGHFE